MELRELRAFVAVVEDGGLSAAARRLHLSQPALSQTIATLERQLGVKLLVRSSTGVSPTEAGTTLVAEARAVLARHDQALRTMAAYSTEGAGVLRLGIPLELPSDLLGPALDRLAAVCPETRVQARHLPTAAQLAALRAGELDVGLLRERPGGPEFDAMPVVRESLGVLLSAEQAAEISGPDGIRLEALGGLEWLSFPRSGSPAWYDEVVAILRSHGVDIGPPAPEGQALIAEVKLAAVAAGKAFALAPPNWAQALPDSVSWSALIGSPLVRRTWAVWPAASRRRDLANFIAGLEEPGVS
ncbi:LysR family transcriptional regulator [Planotetraspora phitsanulokensis]|uniref:LysR family transcriptional regulator n=1 Tax=Planotetraspora phitsanulokensis TaxID=575192 RepID=A0A8J3UAY9_9ACTN|nr:LysR family transcriptional regulator [Planotetraspora phitsanulokensis]GII41246.1 LysR family transcriptional regulator [Planotetraspora phitsanulokensis]